MPNKITISKRTNTEVKDKIDWFYPMASYTEVGLICAIMLMRHPSSAFMHTCVILYPIGVITISIVIRRYNSLIDKSNERKGIDKLPAERNRINEILKYILVILSEILMLMIIIESQTLLFRVSYPIAMTIFIAINMILYGLFRVGKYNLKKKREAEIEKMNGSDPSLIFKNRAI